MAQATRDQLRRERTRQYEALLDAARSRVQVIGLLAKGREARADAHSLEEGFAATDVEGALPAAVWVALRQDDVDATIDALVAAAREQFLIAEHEQLDDTYRLTTVEERIGVPDVELLEAQIAAFLQVPRDVVAIAAGWGPDDPRTAAEIETLLDQRYGPPLTAPQASAQPLTARGTQPVLRMSSAEFSALLSLTATQRGVLGTLVRQTDLLIAAE